MVRYKVLRSMKGRKRSLVEGGIGAEEWMRRKRKRGLGRFE
jgi:hypothetical protein